MACLEGPSSRNRINLARSRSLARARVASPGGSSISNGNHDNAAGARPAEQRQLGAALAELRERHGLTQAAIADRAGVSRGDVSAIESGEVDPSFATLVRIVRAIPAPLAELFELYERRRGQEHG